ncbi:MAG: phosphoglycolate phosphatase [Thermoprotei archaeon]|nr:MAG: phosphoglycolate phosphatase [Thermoprotei archaeon]
MGIRVLVTDVDGVLTDSKGRLDLRAISLLRTLEEKGISVILASGASLPTLLSLRRYLGTSGPVIAENGGVIYINGMVEVLAKRDPVLEAWSELRNVLRDLVIESATSFARLTDVVFRPRSKSLVDYVLLRSRSVLEKYPDLELVYSGFSFHLKPRSTSKYRALLLVLERLGLHLDDVLAVGDSEVDLEMLRYSPYSGVPAHAPECVKSVAKYVSQHPYAMGFIDVVLHYLGKELAPSSPTFSP